MKYADRLFGDPRRSAIFLERVVLQHFDRGRQVTDADRRLGALGEPGGGAHLLGNGLGHVIEALLVFGHDPLEHGEPFLARGAGPCLERLARSFDRQVDIGGILPGHTPGVAYGSEYLPREPRFVAAGLSVAAGRGWARWFAVLAAFVNVVAQIGLPIEFHGPGNWRTRIVGWVRPLAIERQLTVLGSITGASGFQFASTS